MEYPLVDISRGKKTRKNDENLVLWLIVIQRAADQPAYELRAYTKESEDYKVLRLQATDLPVRKEVMDAAKGMFGEPWPFQEEMEQARKAENVS